MSSTKTILILLGLIVGLNLGLRYGWGPLAGSDRSDPKEGSEWVDEVSSEVAIASDPFDSATASAPANQGSDAHGRSHNFRRRPVPISGPPPAGSVMDPESQDLPSLVQGLEAASTPEEQGQWADRIAASGGQAAVEALIQAVTRASLDRRSPEESEALREAFKGFSTEDDMAALVMSLGQTQDIDLIEAVVETLARGARSSTVKQLVQLHDEASTLPSTRAVLGWAIERIRNPEASEALARLVHTAERSELAHPGIIALSSLQSQANGEPAPL
ncbi:MAG: hypothetical protein RLZZ582_598 [Verrucomicrobiota bacterium]|jgi:hypothetical protein|nr:hypothetical protein [Verrucomicrobiota bacterium]